MTQFITIEQVKGEVREKVQQALPFQTGNFVWRVRFNMPLLGSTVNNKTCFVTTMTGEPVKTKIHYNARGNYIEIEPENAYKYQTSYQLTISTNVAATNGKKLKQAVTLRFKV